MFVDDRIDRKLVDLLWITTICIVFFFGSAMKSQVDNGRSLVFETYVCGFKSCLFIITFPCNQNKSISYYDTLIDI